MSKSLLIVDTPTKCFGECNLCKLETDGEIICCFYNKRIGDVFNYEKPDWCPLKPLPKRKEINEIYRWEDRLPSFKCGWNWCLDEIMGEIRNELWKRTF